MNTCLKRDMPVTKRIHQFLCGLLLLSVSVGISAEEVRSAKEPCGIYLTWEGDPCRTMRIDWHLESDAERPRLYVRERNSSAQWTSHQGSEVSFPYSDRQVIREQLTGLQPDSAYEFKFGTGGRVFNFQTMPEVLNRPLRFAVGGDTRHSKEYLEKTNRAAMTHHPEFIVLGGDLCYENGTAGNVGNVIEWFDAYMATLISADGRAIPIVTAVGNHEVRGGYIDGTVGTFLIDEGMGPDEIGDEAFRERLAPYYYALFAPQPGYQVLDFGDYLSLVILDTHHTNRVEGTQTEWLASVLAQRRDRSHVIPVYHVPAFPSVRRFSESVSARVRDHWLPLFEENGVRVAFENHDHVFKRTHPIRDGKVDPNGIVYMGDGAWGVETRKTHDPAETWYLAKAESVRHFMIVTLGPEAIDIETFTEENEPLDTVKISGVPGEGETSSR